jgi:nitroreductase/Pyruvate/2-oxoacid:ferredoxin oxidoreductase delta subunit
MALKTGRADTVAQVTIDYERCIECGLCVAVCKGAPLFLDDEGKVQIDQSNAFGCIGCGQCVAVCPKECITVRGRDLFPKDIIAMPTRESRATYAQLKALMTGRRSVRNFKDKAVEDAMIQKIVDAASTAPMGLPPSDVEILVFKGRKKVKQFANDMIDLMKGQRWIFSPVMRFFMRPFVGKEACESFKNFIVPAVDVFIQKRKAGEDWLLYNAPLALYFHTSPYADPFDPIIVATYAMLAAEALGLGACMIGTPAQFMKYSRRLKRKYGIPLKNQQGITVIFGYPALTYRRGIKRRLAKVNSY